nr:myosin heavy chain kinase B-like [Ipomoea batatas]
MSVMEFKGDENHWNLGYEEQKKIKLPRRLSFGNDEHDSQPQKLVAHQQMAWNVFGLEAAASFTASASTPSETISETVEEMRAAESPGNEASSDGGDVNLRPSL